MIYMCRVTSVNYASLDVVGYFTLQASSYILLEYYPPRACTGFFGDDRGMPFRGRTINEFEFVPSHTFYC